MTDEQTPADAPDEQAPADAPDETPGDGDDGVAVEDLGKAIGEAAVAAVRETLGSVVKPAQEAIAKVTTPEPTTKTTSATDPGDINAIVEKAIADSKAKEAHEAEHAALKSGEKPKAETPAPEIPPKEKVPWLARRLLRAGGGK